MSQREDIRPRTFMAASPAVNQDLTALAESTQHAIDSVPLISFRWVRGVVATGTGGAELTTVLWGPAAPWVITRDAYSPPDVAIVVRAVEQGDRTADSGNVRPRYNFDYRPKPGGSHEVVVYEPAGLVADEYYDLLVMFVAGVGG